MIRASAFILLATALVSNDLKENEKLTRIETEFPLLWKSKIGNVSFRSNLILNPSKLIIGSNGDQFMDYNLFDKSSGVYFLNRKNGKIENHFGAECMGDMDVTGILSYNNNLYFGNDNEEFFCTSMQGKVIWRNATSGDIEHEPVLIQAKKEKEIIYASESGEIRAVNPESGKTIWVYYTPEFDSWKPGDNRFAFKVKSYFSNTASFFTKPLLYDLNHDGITDLVYLTYSKKLYAINGQDGTQMWTFQNEDNTIHRINPFMTDKGDLRFMLFCSNFQNGTYSNYIINLNSAGHIINSNQSKCNIYEMSLNSIITKSYGTIYADRESIFLLDKNGEEKEFNCFFEGKRRKYYGSDSETVSRKYYDPLLSNEMFNFQNNKDCIVLLNQHDYLDFEKGFIEIFSLDKKEVIKRFAIPSSSEMCPVIKDINNDGYLDLLINCADGYLYCYNLKIKA